MATLAIDPPATTRAPTFEPPGFVPPEDWPAMLRWLPAARRNALELFPRACFEAPLVEHRVFGRRVAVLSDPAAIAEVTGSASARYRLTTMHLRMLSPALGRGVIVAEGERWRRQRRIALRLVADARARPAASGAARIARTIEAWHAAPAPVAIQSDLALLAIDLLAAELFRHHGRIGDARIDAAIGRHRALVERADLLDLLGAPLWLPTPRLRRARAVVGGFDRDIHAAIAASRDFAPPPDMDAAARRDLVVNLLSGFESIGTTAAWLLGLIAAQPALYDWLRDPAVDANERARRLDAAVAETLRLYPPLPMIYRHALADHATSAGMIRRGTMLCISPYVVHRHETLWAAPARFDPDRARCDAKPPAFMPFGTGARQCVGRHIGPRLIAQIVGATIAAVRPRLAAPFPRPRAGLSLRPETPLQLELRGG